MRIKAKIKNNKVTVKILAKHQMLGEEEAKAKNKKTNYITSMTVKINQKIVYTVNLSQFVSKDPYTKFYVSANDIKKGDMLEASWVDITGQTKTDSVKIK